jgi:pimeloyl-ACP methyl ester carboxylesterase
VSPLGLWRDDSPIRNYIVTPQTELPALLFKDAHHPSLKRIILNPEDQQGYIRITWALGCTGKFMWPIPDKGLKKRIHRIKAIPTLLVWGQDDRLVPLVYKDEFARRLERTRLEVVKNAGHAPHLEQPETTANVVQAFLKE